MAFLNKQPIEITRDVEDYMKLAQRYFHAIDDLATIHDKHKKYIPTIAQGLLQSMIRTYNRRFALMFPTKEHHYSDRFFIVVDNKDTVEAMTRYLRAKDINVETLVGNMFCCHLNSSFTMAVEDCVKSFSEGCIVAFLTGPKKKIWADLTDSKTTTSMQISYGQDLTGLFRVDYYNLQKRFGGFNANHLDHVLNPVDSNMVDADESSESEQEEEDEEDEQLPSDSPSESSSSSESESESSQDEVKNKQDAQVNPSGCFPFGYEKTFQQACETSKKRKANTEIPVTHTKACCDSYKTPKVQVPKVQPPKVSFVKPNHKKRVSRNGSAFRRLF